MSQLRILAAAAAAVAIVASACGGAAVAPTAAPVAQTAAPTVAPTATPVPTLALTPTTAAGKGAASAKLGESTLELAEPAASLAAGKYLQTVSLVTLEKGGWTVAHKHGGIESIYVLEGTVDFRTQGGGRVILETGQGAAVPAGTILQAVNGGTGIARFIAFFLTAEGAPFSTNSEQAP